MTAYSSLREDTMEKGMHPAVILPIATIYFQGVNSKARRQITLPHCDCSLIAGSANKTGPSRSSEPSDGVCHIWPTLLTALPIPALNPTGLGTRSQLLSKRSLIADRLTSEASAMKDQNEVSQNPGLIHVHRCAACGVHTRRERLNSRDSLSGLFECPACGQKGPLNIEIVKERALDE